MFFFLFKACTSIIFFFRSVRIYVLSLLFWLTVYTSIIFSFYIVRIYVLSLLFLVYSVHINHFFFSIVRICILSLFFLFTACTSVIFFFYKNLYTFFFVFVYSVHFRKRFNIPVYLNLSLSISKRTWQTKLVQSKKYWKNNMRTFFPISVIPLPQLVCHKIFFSLPISAIPLPLFFPPQFRQWHCRNRGNFFFFSSTISAMALPKLWGKNYFFPTFSAIPLLFSLFFYLFTFTATLLPK